MGFSRGIRGSRQHGPAACGVTLGDCLTCTAICGGGLRTRIRAHPRRSTMALAVCCVAARSSLIRRACGLPPVRSTCRRIGTSMSVSVRPERTGCRPKPPGSVQKPCTDATSLRYRKRSPCLLGLGPQASIAKARHASGVFVAVLQSALRFSVVAGSTRGPA